MILRRIKSRGIALGIIKTNRRLEKKTFRDLDVDNVPAIREIITINKLYNKSTFEKV